MAEADAVTSATPLGVLAEGSAADLPSNAEMFLGDDTAANAHDDFTQRHNRGSHIISCHEERTQHYAACANMENCHVQGTCIHIP